MKLSVDTEFGVLRDLCVGRGVSVPEHDTYRNDHPEFNKYNIRPWNKAQLLEQQERFFEVLDKHDVRLHFTDPDPETPWQMYTRDTGFVVGDRFYCCEARGLPEREGELAALRRGVPQLADGQIVTITEGRIEGGDVLVDGDRVWVGLSTRTTRAAVGALSDHVEVEPLFLGDGVMHLDTRMTILARGHALLLPSAFTAPDIERLSERFTLIPVTEDEAQTLGTNVFAIDPETVVVEPSHDRIAGALRDTGFRVVPVPYSEPIALAGSFRCSTMPLRRDAA